MEEADQLCNRLAIIDHGHLLALDTPVGAQALHRADTVVTVTRDGDLDALAKLREADVTRAPRRSVDDTVVVDGAGDGRLLPARLRRRRSRGFDGLRPLVDEPTLETVFINLTGKDLRE